MVNIFKMSKDELLDVYGIELNADGTVFDPVENKTFKNLGAWKLHADQQEKEDMRGGVDKLGGRYAYDDEY